MAIQLSVGSRNAAANGVVGQVDAAVGAGRIIVYTGTPPAAAADIATGTVLVTFTLNDPAFTAAATGTASAVLTPAISATGTAAGTAGYYRIVDAAATPVVAWQGTVTATGGGGDMTMNTTTISVGLTVNLTALSYTQPSG